MTKLDEIARAICAETCAFKGEPPCHSFKDEAWPNPDCNEPGCHALSSVALDAMAEPTQAMLCDGTNAEDKYYFEADDEKRVTAIYAAMIEAAKGEGK